MKKIAILVALLIISMAVNLWLLKKANKPAEVKVEHHVEWITIRDTTPIMTESHHTGETITVTAAVHHHAMIHEPDVMPDKATADTLPTVSIMGDSATVTLPVEQRVYEDSLYTAYVSGYRPSLDSINLRLPHTYTTITKTVSKPAKRWAVGPSVGVGYGLAGKQADVFVGFTATFRLWP